MRVVHFIDTMDPAQGGPPMAVVSLAGAQANLGAHVSIAWQRSSRGASLALTEAFPSVPGVKQVDGVGYMSWHSISASLLQTVAKKSGDDQFDAMVWHFQGIWRPEFMRLIRVARTHRVPYVVSAHGMLMPWALRQKRIKKWLAYKLFWQKAINRAGMVHALTVTEKRQFSKLGITAPVRVIPNGVLSQTYSETASDTGAPIRPYVLAVGRLHSVKGFDRLIQAFALLAAKYETVDLLIVGPDYGEGESLQKQIHALGLEGRVRLAGPIYGAEKDALVAGATCFAQLSHSEGFSMAVLEALNAGLPAVVSPAGALPGMEEVGAGIVVSGDVQEIAGALERYVADSDERETAGRAGRDLVRKSFQWPVIARDFLSSYELMLAAT